jgi:hypothetical protein
MRRLLLVTLLAVAAAVTGAAPALAGPGCPTKPGVCAPGGNFPW